MTRLRWLTADPRHYQIAVLAALLLYGVFHLALPIAPERVALILGVALATQAVCTVIWRLPSFDPRSPLISGLSLCLLLRTEFPLLAAFGAAIAISSKFAIRRRGKHVFNPTNFALVALLLLTDRAWVSPGQWGSAAFFGFAMAGLGGLVVYRAARSDVTYAFIAAYAAILFGRALWLGDPWSIPIHQLQSGAFLLFAFYMISDPRTTPDSRTGRILYATLVAAGAGVVHYVFFTPNGFLWSLVCCAPLVPVIDRLLPGRRYEWPGAGGTGPSHSASRRSPARTASTATAPAYPALVSAALDLRKETSTMKLNSLRSLLAPLALAGMGISVLAPLAQAFCGFYVARADAKLFNQSSQVVLVRDANRTVITMAADYQGDPEEFALVVPVPTFLERDQIHIGDQAVIDHLDAFSGPRLVEYFDEDPCIMRAQFKQFGDRASAPTASSVEEERYEGVTIEATYTVGEYDILILSAKESSGLSNWLTDNGYQIPPGAKEVLSSYIKQDMRFFVAKVNLKEKASLGFANLRPIQVAYESAKFMLPLRLGTVNASGPQDLILYAITPNGRVEPTNYRSVELPTGMDLPDVIKDDFPAFYQALFDNQVDKYGMRAVFTEYAWNMSWCDPCASPPLSPEELGELGVFWLVTDSRFRGQPSPSAFLTRMHVRYDREHFPEDLMLQETGNQQTFQARYVLRHAWRGAPVCSAAREYLNQLKVRKQQEAEALADLTGWDLHEIRSKMNLDQYQPVTDPEPWWRRLWKN